MSRYKIEKAEEGTPKVDDYLSSGWEPFAVVSDPVMEAVVAYDRERGYNRTTGEYRHVGSVNVIWFRREATK